MPDVKSKVRAFIIENYLFGDDEGLGNNTSFLEEGIIDSMGILELVDFIDKQFSVTIADEELLPENLDSVNNIADFLGSKLKLNVAS